MSPRLRDVTVGTVPATLVEAVAIADSAGVAIGTSSYAYIVDYGDAGTLADPHDRHGRRTRTTSRAPRRRR